jgi:intein-encoded DNA endonuclease-like protein
MANKRNSKCLLEKEEMIKYYQKGLSTTEIASLANVSSRYVRTVLTKAGIEKRPAGHWKRKYTLNEDYFKTWSNNMAYILGFFTADGLIVKDLQTVSFSQKEKTILEEIKKELGSTQPLYINKNTGVYMLNLHSKIMKEDLMQIHGLTPNKSQSVLFPKVPEEYLHHFIRGYFDGDGSINYPKYTVSFVGGSFDFMNMLTEILRKRGFEPFFTSQQNEKIFRVFVTGRRTIKCFAEWIYQEKGLYVKRKYKDFQQEPLELYQLKDRKLKITQKAVTERKKRFLYEYNQSRCVNKACEVVGIQQNTFKYWLKKDLEFKKNFEQQN